MEFRFLQRTLVFFLSLCSDFSADLVYVPSGFFLSLASPSRETITFLHFFSYYDSSFLRFMVTRYCLPLLFVTFYSYFYPPPLTMCHVLELGQRTWNKLLGDNQFFDPMVELQLSNKIWKQKVEIKMKMFPSSTPRWFKFLEDPWTWTERYRESNWKMETQSWIRATSFSLQAKWNS